MVLLSTRDSSSVIELQPVAPQWYLPASFTQAPMQLHQNPRLKGTLVKNKTGSPSGSPETALLRTTAKPLWAPRQSGDRADFIAQELDMVSTSTTTPLTEQYTQDDKAIDWSQMEGSACPDGFASLVEDYHEDPPTGTLNTAIFDVQLDLSMGMGDELLLPSLAGALSTPPSMTGMMNSVLPSERPISPSEFLHKPAPSSQHQLLDIGDFSPEVDKMIEELLPHTSADVNWDSSQLDLNLFNHPDESDTLGCLVQDCGILEETEEESGFHLEHLDILPTAVTQQAVTSLQPLRPQRASVRPVRVRRERRASRKPARFRDGVCLDEDMATATTTKVSVRVMPEEAVASTSDTTSTRRRGSSAKELSNEEKYLRSRQQNNLASKRCREKRRANLEKMVEELQILEERNKVLSDKVAKLTALRDEFQKFVNNFLFQRMMEK